MRTHVSSATYEVTVTGGIGPVLRHALRPHVTARSLGYTIVRLEDPGDLVDLLGMLHTAGVEVDSIAELGED